MSCDTLKKYDREKKMRISFMFCLPICLATYGQVSNRTWHMLLAMIFFLKLGPFAVFR